MLFQQQFLGGTSLPLDYERILSKFRKYYLQKIPLETKVKASLDLYFTMTTEENDSRYILTAYTSVTMFYKILNKHLATYRGMLMTRDDLIKYNVGSQIMNVSFSSTSENKQVARTFAGENTMDALRQTPDRKAIHLSAVCAYHTKHSRTALQLESISEMADEEEILILPFSAFEIVGVNQYNGRKNNGIMVEIELEECDETI
ncbi:unnamed protein product [Didymodactylos carnosus]|uniref:NAD(+)--protein-arginine ADP-ribosyltransferase n=1 Tax=Didymodactylos carnosus TaxID=1234261 RepID=A0A8S2FM35_9BILA|nr:unnamed protein product [Didymodactylos carnosus]CAF4294276.1 unnamed protein product [Didymodactylos carnosus]